MSEIPWGPTGELVYNRTYSRTKPDGSRETWPETVERVVSGNLGLVEPRYHLPGEREDLIRYMTEFKILPGGRHLWASGVRGRQYLFNCHVSGWDPDDVTRHFEFTFLRLMEGGGVGATYSNRLIDYPIMRGAFRVHVVCDPGHPDYRKLQQAGALSTEYDSDWEGAFEVEDSREGWAAALVDLMQTYYRDAENTNRVFDVSRVRGEGSRLKTFGGRASGPLPLALMLTEVSEIMNRAMVEYGWLRGMDAMEIDHAIAKCVVSGGNRRSARMAIMHWADPQIEQFVNCKKETGSHWTTNISVEVDDEFFARVAAGRPDATTVLRWIAEGMLTNGEPGIWNSTLSNEGEPNEVIATNPCGEICLEGWENCNLGHVNLAAFVNDDATTDWDGLGRAHRLMTRFLIRATYGDVNDPKQAAVLARNRRIGVGHLGVASYLAKSGIPYTSGPTDPSFCELLNEMADQVDRAAVRYSHQLRIPIPVKTRTVAPTGTIAKMPGVSEGIHPIFAKYFIRRIRLSSVDPDQFDTAMRYAAQGYNVEECQYAPSTLVVEIPTKDILVDQVAALHGADAAERLVQPADYLSLREMLNMQAVYQELWADNAVSYTANIDPDAYDVIDIMETIENYGPELKGMTVFPEASMPQAPYERIYKEEYEAAAAKAVEDSVDEDCANGACPVR